MAQFRTLGGMTEAHAAAKPDAPALVFGESVLSWSALHDRVLRTVAALRAAGIGPGDRVGWLALNHGDYVVLFEACSRLGAVLVAINARLVAREIAFILKDADIRLLVTEIGFREVALAALEGTGVETIVLLDDAHDGRPPFAEWIGGHAPDAAAHDADPQDIAIQLYTSGTTGFPKGALLTHANLLGVMELSAATGEDWAVWHPHDTSLIAMPVFHIAGAGMVVQGLNAGIKMVVLPRPDIGEVADAIVAHRVSKLFLVPAVLNMLLDHPRGAAADFGHVRAMLYGASPIPLDVLRRSMAKFPNAAFVQCYGATETTGTVVYLPAADHHPDGTPRMLGCGKPYPGNEVRIVGENGEILGPRQVGEIALKSISVMAGYHNRPEATEAAIRDGWYHTGDAGYLDEDGYLYIYDRVKDMIVSGAENIYPAEVENALHEHPAVKDCAVIGVPDPKWGEAVKAIVVKAPGKDVTPAELIAFARERIAGYKVPKTVDFIDELPRNPSGKILKKELRKPFWPEGERQVG